MKPEFITIIIITIFIIIIIPGGGGFSWQFLARVYHLLLGPGSPRAVAF